MAEFDLLEKIKTYEDNYDNLMQKMADAGKCNDIETIKELDKNIGNKIRLEGNIKRFLTPKDPNDLKNILVEIRGGAGGDEAALFAGELYRMYTRYAENKKWQHNVLSSNSHGVGGFKEIIFEINGRGLTV